MPKSKRSLLATAQLTTAPPDALPPNCTVARVTRSVGNNLYYVECPRESRFGVSVNDPVVENLVELHPRFRNAIWLKRGSYVIVDMEAMAERENKLEGEIVNVVREEKLWRKMRWWPEQFKKKDMKVVDDSDEEESTVGRMPPSDDEEED